MKLRIASDLHLEFDNGAKPDSGRLAVDLADSLKAGLSSEDLLILAGDTHTKGNGVAWAKAHFRGLPLLMISGNHEYYGAKYPRQTERNQEQAQGSDVFYLENQSLTLGSLHFFGATLWTDYAAFGDTQVSKIVAASEMNDYKRIRHSGHAYCHLKPEHLQGAHEQAKQALITFLADKDPSRCVIVTHHAPSTRSVSGRYGSQNPLNAAYASNLDALIAHFQPRLWIHGHIHESNRYWLGNTEVICNPRGYIKNPNPHFDCALTVEL